ncbi:MAG: transketolase [Deltaproteobacteria bacterium]|nr:transketolase [Deltaproteobacteria bacterium]
MTKEEKFEQRCINTIRFLAADAVEKAKSGHPGMPMGAAAMAYVLWRRHVKHNPANPLWIDRDRVVLSAGHASMLLYAMLYLTGYDITLEDIQSFRQWGSKTPGHPERCQPPGAEMTTGPLGQGLASACGIALAEAHLAATYNRPGQDIIRHFTYVLASDGDLMEGVSAEACSLAGHLGLGKLIVLYDDNGVCLAGSTGLSFTEDVGMRFAAYGWHVEKVDEGNDTSAIDAAISKAKAETNRPSIICVRTTIGYGAPNKENTSDAHGSPLGKEELLAAKKRLGWPAEPDFLIPEEVLAHFREALKTGQDLENQWEKRFSGYADQYPEPAREFQRIIAGTLPDDWESALPSFPDDSKDMATRKASETIMQAVAPRLPELMGGSADLNPSTFTWLKGLGDFQKPGTDSNAVKGTTGSQWNFAGRNIHFGVREHAMAAMINGMAIHGGFIPYASTFLTFSDYMRPSIRLAAMMRLRVVYVFTHDSIGLGEDGPTHQPIEQVMNLRCIPNMTVIRPADANETAEAWKYALQNQNGPTALILTRQNLPVLNRSELEPAECLQRGAYILWDSSTILPQVILLATGSEVEIAMAAARKLFAEGLRVRVVSMPSWELFELQPPEYRDSILPASVRARVSVEAGVRIGWERHVGFDGAMVGMDNFGASAPAKVLYEKFGFTADNVVAVAKTLIK